MKILKLMKLASLMILTASVFSCSKEYTFTVKQNEVLKQAEAQRDFTKVLSKALFRSESLRAFIKKQADKQFDKDYDVLYHQVKDSLIEEGLSFRNLLVSVSEDSTTLSAIESQLPLLTILVPDWSWTTCGFCNDTWNTSSDFVLVSYELDPDGRSLYADGDKIDELREDEYPSCPVLIVKNNDRVKVSPVKTKSIPEYAYSFIDPVFNGAVENYANVTNRNRTLGVKWKNNGDIQISEEEAEDNCLVESEIAPVVIDAYNEFKDNIYAAQRDYIYYGMTNENNTGVLVKNKTIAEKLYKIKLRDSSSKTLYDGSAPADNDVSFLTYTTKGNGSYLTSSQLSKKAWTDGGLELYINIYHMSNDNSATYDCKYIPVKFEDLFSLEKVHVKKKHTTWVKWHTEYRYWVDENCFRPKWHTVDLKIYKNWDISQESAAIKLEVIELDPDQVSTYETSYEGVFAHNFEVTSETSGTVGGTIDKVQMSVTKKIGFKYGTSNTTKHSEKISVQTTGGPDNLGSDILNYDAPIIKGSRIDSSGKVKYDINILNTGYVQLMVLPCVE